MSYTIKKANDIKQRVFESKFSKMNDMQKKAIFTVNGPLLILAGAGSGKTTVLVNRIAHLLNFGNTYYDECDIDENGYNTLSEYEKSGKSDDKVLKSILKVKPLNPWNVLAITFTNKAANELKARLTSLLADVGADVNAGTFHSICLRVLRREIERLGYAQSFTIYDSDDAQRMVKDCQTELMVDDKMFPPKVILGEISRAKDAMISPEEYASQNETDFRKKIISNIYTLYQRRLKANNAVDFDDIICLVVHLFEEYPEVLEHYQNLYRYIHVDEYQDTNHAQYRLIQLLSQKYKNLCVVGDDDQSIYKFRGATIENILNFEKDFNDACVIRLEQNYRSTQNILSAANEIIKNNSLRKGKNLWTDQGDGEKITLYHCVDENAEAQFVGNKIQENVQKGSKFADNAVLYRMNAQSSNVERTLVRMGVPYRIVGGTKFYDRKEIKDVMAYLHVIDNPNDTIRLKRIINEPKRGIGDTTIKNIEAISQQEGISMIEVMKSCEKYTSLVKKAVVLLSFCKVIDDLRELVNDIELADLLTELMERTNYVSYLKAQGFEGEGRLENIEELKTNLIHYSNENQEVSLRGFLEEIALYTDLDNMNDDEDKVILMTMHSAKGLEFKNVFIISVEENIFPSYLSLNSEVELEEERRLAYVAVTRAKEQLYLSNASQRMLFGRTSRNQPSRFLREIPEEFLEVIDETISAYGYAPRKEKPKAVYKPEIEGTVGVAKVAEKATINYAVGDNVSHGTFGDGVVKSMTNMSNDVLVEVEFSKVGVKKIMANFAKLEKQ